MLPEERHRPCRPTVHILLANYVTAASCNRTYEGPTKEGRLFELKGEGPIHIVIENAHKGVLGVQELNC